VATGFGGSGAAELERGPRAPDNPTMPRMNRSLRPWRASARRRHRTWMLAMGLASVGWGFWWLELALWRFVPQHAPSLTVVGTAAGIFAVAGTIAAVLTLRGRNRVWIAIACVPLFANLALLFVPFLLPEGMGQAR